MKGIKERKAVIIGFAVFLLFMIVCTITAKGIYRVGLAKVTLAKIDRRNINHEVTAIGKIEQGQEFGIYVPEGLRVATILVQNGSSFQKQDFLFQIDTKDLEDKIKQKELEIMKLNQEQEQEKESNNQVQQGNHITLTRAKEDYEKAVRDADLKINRANLQLAEAKKELEQKQKELEEAIVRLEETKKEKQNKNAENQDIEGQGSVSSGDAQSAINKQQQLTEREQEVKQAQQETAEAEKIVKKENQAVEDALLEKEDNLQTAKRIIEDAKLAEKNSVSNNTASIAQIKQAEKEYLESQLEELKALAEADGWVTANENGYVTAQKLQVGERTADTACICYTLDDGSRILKVSLTKEQMKYVEMGDTAVLEGKSKTTGSKWKQEGIISYLENQQEGNQIASLEITQADSAIGQMVNFSLVKQSESYELCIPVSSLYENMGNYYVYTVEEQEGILGVEWHIQKTMVNVLDKNNSYAAIEGTGITKESKIIGISNKPFQEGDVVRIIES